MSEERADPITMAEPQPTLQSLAAKVSELTETFSKWLDENKVPQPSFAADSTLRYSNLTQEMFVTRQLLTDALMDLWYLTQGPSESVFNYVHNVSQKDPQTCYKLIRMCRLSPMPRR